MENQINLLWEKALSLIQENISSIRFNTWIRPLDIHSLDDDTLILLAKEPFTQKMVIENYIPLIQSAFEEICHKRYIIIIESVQKSENKNENIKLSNNNFLNKSIINEYDDNNRNQAKLNPRYIFDTFVVGNSNRMAHAASLAVADSPAKAYNPLFLYGGVGLGKTHLMQSIAHFILNEKPDTKVVYVSSEKFTNELINSIKNNTNEQFRNKYRNIDILLVDDIQFIADKEQTQEEFFHTFNTLYEENKQIIISSDRPPKEIKSLAERLRSRFEWGLIADVQQPDYETRIAILRKKAELETFVVPSDVLAFIAKSIVSNIRELEGALTSIIAYSTLIDKEITIELAERALKDLVSEEAAREISPKYILEVVSNYYDLKYEDLLSKKRTQSIAFPRQIAMYLSRKLTDESLPKIGQVFGGRDHTTIMYGCDKISKEIKSNPKTESAVLEIERRILGE